MYADTILFSNLVDHVHMQAQRHASQLNPTTTATPVEDIEVEDDDDIEVDDDLEDFTPTQR